MAIMAKLPPHSPSPTHISLSIPLSLPPPPPQRRNPSKIPPNHSTRRPDRALIMRRSDFLASATPPPSWSLAQAVAPSAASAPPVVRKRTRYRREYPGESKGITEEMRFVAMRLRNIGGKKYSKNDDDSSCGDDNDSALDGGDELEESDGDEGDTWQPSVEGFVSYLVDSKLVFDTVERIVDESEDVAYAYFRNTGLERSEVLSRDIEWFRQQGVEISVPTNPGVSYAMYLEELSGKSAPLFLCHFYNIYFSHIAGGRVIVKQVSEKMLDGRELEFCRWEGNVQELLRGVRQKLNMLGEHWSRDQKNKCLREAAKSFRYLGQIVRLIIL